VFTSATDRCCHRLAFTDAKLLRGVAVAQFALVPQGVKGGVQRVGISLQWTC
jgi:hypothetical protein